MKQLKTTFRGLANKNNDNSEMLFQRKSIVNSRRTFFILLIFGKIGRNWCYVNSSCSKF